MELCKGSIPFTQIFDFVLSVDMIELDVKLSALVIISTAHDWIHRWLFFTCIRIIRIISRDYKIIHFFLQNLLSCCCIFYKTPCCSCTVLWAHIIIIILCSIFHTKICESIEFLSSWTILITYNILNLLILEIILLMRNNTQRINQKCKVFFKMSRAQNFQL